MGFMLSTGPLSSRIMSFVYDPGVSYLSEGIHETPTHILISLRTG